MGSRFCFPGVNGGVKVYRQGGAKVYHLAQGNEPQCNVSVSPSWGKDWVAVGKGERSALSTSAVATLALIHSLIAPVVYASCFA
jgi:hypothetical protein